jgi:hypothetical protein
MIPFPAIRGLGIPLSLHRRSLSEDKTWIDERVGTVGRHTKLPSSIRIPKIPLTSNYWYLFRTSLLIAVESAIFGLKKDHQASQDRGMGVDATETKVDTDYSGLP